MNSLPDSVQNLIDEFTKLPGIGPKSAARLTFYLLRGNDLQAQKLSAALRELRERLVYCSSCFNFAEEDPCPICSSHERDQKQICVVSEPLDVLALERTADFKGVYHVLHGEISPVDGIGPDDLRIGQLVNRVKKLSAELDTQKLIEIILATNPTMEGETTALYIAKMLENFDVKMTRIARGLPVGGDLEYADEITLASALSNRRDFSS